MSKELWLEEYEKLAIEKGYPPSGEEVDEACADRLAHLADQARSRERTEGPPPTSQSRPDENPSSPRSPESSQGDGHA